MTERELSRNAALALGPKASLTALTWLAPFGPGER